MSVNLLLLLLHQVWKAFKLFCIPQYIEYGTLPAEVTFHE